MPKKTLISLDLTGLLPLPNPAPTVLSLEPPVLRFSANLGFMWAEFPLLDAIAAASNAGFRAVELHFPYTVPALEVKAACTENSVRLLGLNTDIAPGSNGHFGLGAVPGQSKPFRHLANAAFSYAELSGAGYVHIMAGLVEPGDSDAGQAIFVENLKWAASRAEDLGLILLLEPLNNIDVPGYFYSNLSEASHIIDVVGAPNIRLMFDAYHVGMEQGDVIATLKTYYQQIGHIQVASVPDRAEPDTGDVDYKKLVRALESLNYQGWIGCEYKPRSSVEAGLSWTKTLGVQL